MPAPNPRRSGAAIASSLAVLLSLAAGCAAPPPRQAAPPVPPAPEDLFVLLPAQDGQTGAVSVMHGSEQRILDVPYATARIEVEGRLETGLSTEAEVRRIWGDALAALPPRPVSFLLYFLEGKDELTPESERVIQQIFAEIARRPAPEIAVIGHTDRVGSVQFNDALSLRRAQKIRDDLVRLGVVAEQIQVAGRGEREPLVPTEDEIAEPRNRRVEISVR
jgi:outer membrane protein OmpA-like peptidoglycan-associated protein